MKNPDLNGKRIAILATDGVEQVELAVPRKALGKAGAEAQVIGLRPGAIQGMNHREFDDKISVFAPVREVTEADFDALVLPGGVANSDELRTDPDAVVFVRDFFFSRKPVAAICRGGGHDRRGGQQARGRSRRRPDGLSE